jgi:hypothetical protein
MRSLAILALLAGIARADVPEVAVAVNAPFRWVGGDAVAVSGYVGLTERQALRLNVASYTPSAALGDAISIAMGGDGDEASRSGRITDVGAGWMFFPDGLWHGFTIELGALVRARSTHSYDDNASPAIVDTDTRTLAGRALVGWSWTIGAHVFISAQAGLSAGWATGHETTSSDQIGAMAMTVPVSRSEVAAEGFVRIGARF